MQLREDSYVPPGSLPTPGWLGRGIRLVLGVLLLESAFSLGAAFQQLVHIQAVPASISLWGIAILLLFAMRDVVNLGLSVLWGRKAQLLTLGLGAIAIAIDLIAYGRVWAPPLVILFTAWFLLVAIPLGIALILAALLGTPGCEMRSYAALLAKLQGRSASEHYCPGGIDFVDRWGPRPGKR